MSMQDPVADMITRIRNAQAVNKSQLNMPSSKLKIAIARVLKDEGYINDFEVFGEGPQKDLVIFLKYYRGKPVIESIKRISRPGLRVYRNHKNLPQVIGGYGVAVISTPKGVMADRDARKAKLGGEVLIEVA